MRILNKPQTISRIPVVRAGAALTVSLFALTGCTAGSTESSSPEPSASSTVAGSTSSPSQSSGKTGFSKQSGSASASAEPQESSSATAGASASAQKSSEDKTKEFDFELKLDGDFADYVQATETNRATGVPRPIEPEGMNENTEEGFARFATYYMAERN